MKKRIFSMLLMGAMVVASMSMFTSCKDYDDDINKNSTDISALKSELASLKSQLTSDLSTAKAELQTLIAAKQDKGDYATKSDLTNVENGLSTDISNVQKALSSDLANLTAYVAALETKINAIEATLGSLDETYATDAEVAVALAATYATVTGDLSALETAINNKLAEKANAADVTAKEEALKKAIADAAAQNLKQQTEALEALKSELTKQIEALGVAKGDKEAIETMKKDLEAQIEAVKKSVSALQTSLEGYVKTSELKNYTTVAAFNEYVESAKTSIGNNASAIADIKTNYATTASVIEKLGSYVTTASLDEYKKVLAQAMDTASKTVNGVNDRINTLEVLVKKMLTSVVLKPSFYWEGIEAIEAGFISKTPIFVPVQKDYKFTYQVTAGGTLGANTVDVTVKEVMSSPVTDNKTFVVLEGGVAGGETISNAAAKIAQIWATGETTFATPSLTTADVDAAVLAQAGAKVAPKKKDIQQAVIGYWHINPSKADIEGATLSFFENDAPVYTRGEFDSDKSIAATPYETTFNSKENKYNVLKNSILKVPFKVNFANVLAMFNAWAATGSTTIDPAWDTDLDGSYGAENKKLPFISLQVAAKDTTVNSDYAVLVPAKYTIVALADKAPEVALDQNSFVGWDKHAGMIRANHLYESVGYNPADDWSDKATASLGAIPMPATHGVQYDSLINLKPFIQTHVSYESYTKYGYASTDRLMTDAELAAFGLHYEFTPITYITSKNVTDQSAHIQQVNADGTATTDKTSGYFAPRSVTDKGETILDKKATREVIDREPLVRVDLVDEAGDIVRYGYIKLRIVEKKTPELYEDKFASFEFGDVYMNCGTEVRVTWSQMENKILAQLNMTKQEFEQNYYMENAGAYKEMPTDAGTTACPSGTLYANAQANSWWAVRYATGAKGGSKPTTKTLYNGTATENIFGRVWYTPHDNSTSTHAWDENTNVIVWNLYPGTSGASVETGGNMDAAAYKQMMAAIGATYDTKGMNAKALSTVIRFINKNTGASVWVTLTLPVDKIHFQYAGIGNKDWSHWWEMNSQKAGYSGTAAPYWAEFDVHANTPVPAANAYNALTVQQFEQDLYDYWKNKNILSLGYAKGLMSKFYAPAPVATFEFTTPVKDLNSQITSAASGKWKVKGISGTVWTLALANSNKSIVAVEKDGKAYGPEVICYLSDALDTYTITTTNGSVIHYNGLETAANLYPAATDLLNKSGRYDAVGNARYTKSADATKAAMGILDAAAYLEKDIDETFTAYLKINVTHGCYDPLMGMNYFNVRFLRPINVAAKDYRVRDVLNKMQRIMISDLVDIIDYRDIPVVPYYADKAIKQVFNYGGTQFTAPKYTDVTPDNGLTVKEQNKGVPYEYYGITDLAVYYDNIRTDHDQEYTVRVANDALGAKIPVATVEKLTKVKDLSSLASELTGSKPARVVSLYSNMSTIATDAPYVGTPMAKDTQWAVGTYLVTADGAYSRNIGKIEYTNNSGITQLFHIYVPIAVRYNWGNIRLDEVFGKPAVLDKNFTQTVWAVITVDPSYKEGSGDE